MMIHLLAPCAARQWASWRRAAELCVWVPRCTRCSRVQRWQPLNNLNTQATPTNPPNGDEVFEGLGHFQTLDAQVPRVQKVVDPLAAALAVVERLSLRGCRALREQGPDPVSAATVWACPAALHGVGVHGCSTSACTLHQPMHGSRRHAPAPARCRGAGNEGPRRPCECPTGGGAGRLGDNGGGQGGWRRRLACGLAVTAARGAAWPDPHPASSGSPV